MLSKVPEGLLIFLDSNWTRVGDAAFKVFDLYLDLAFCSGDVAQQWIHRGGYQLPPGLSFDGESLVTNV
jgi:hypothetical protein